MDYPDAFTLLAAEPATVRVEPPDLVIVEGLPVGPLRFRRELVRTCSPMQVSRYRAQHDPELAGNADDIVIRFEVEGLPPALLGPFEAKAGLALSYAIDRARGTLLFAHPGLAISIARDGQALVIVSESERGTTGVPVPTALLEELAVRDDDRIAAKYRLPTGLASGRWLALRFLSGDPWLFGPFASRDAAAIAFAFRTWRGQHPIDREPATVSVRDLVADPVRWHGRRITATGEWHNQFEGSQFANAWLEAPESQRVGPGSYRVRVVGTWIYPDAKAEGGYGHMGCSPGELRAETIEILEVRDNALDGLTQLLKKAVLHPRFEAARAEGPIALALFDLDHFKRYNDTHGFLAGDELLRGCARAFATLGAGAIVARWGGEEFAALLPAATARADAERVRAAIAVLGITCSAGLAAALPGESFSALAARADLALDAAKRAGRDRLVVG